MASKRNGFSRMRLSIFQAAKTLAAALGILLLVPHYSDSQVEKYRKVTIHNAVPRRDNRRAIVDAHDGNLQFFNGRYYLYGTAYGKTAGFSINNRFRVYSSADLEHWTFEGELLKAPPDGVYYRPYVVFNALTKKYVLWFNWYPKLWDGKAGIATSDSPIGPFVIVNNDVQLSESANKPGDGSLFVDEDKKAYYIYTVIGLDHSIFVERLADDYLSSSGEASSVLAKGCEAPALFRNRETYYAMFDTTCCFCTKGSGARVYKASSPLGPYTLSGNINRDVSQVPIIAAQQTYVATLPTPDGNALMWMGDGWGSRPDKIKGHDYQYWSPLHIREDGSIEQLKFERDWTFSVETSGSQDARVARHPYRWPPRSDPHPLMRDACTQVLLSPQEAGVVIER